MNEKEMIQLYTCMCEWEEKGLVDYSLMQGFDYFQRLLADKLGKEYKPFNRTENLSINEQK